MEFDKFVEGLTILRKYYDDPSGYHIGAQHDQFYAGATNQPLMDADFVRMKALGWFQPEQDYDSEDDDAIPYDPEDGWSAFT